MQIIIFANRTCICGYQIVADSDLLACTPLVLTLILCTPLDAPTLNPDHKMKTNPIS
jgi:hypothetical protein